MEKAWAIIDIDETIVGLPFQTKEGAQRQIDSMSYFGELLEVREIDINNEPLDEEGRELEEKLKNMLKGTVHLHISKGIKFYSLSLKERYRSVINMLESARSPYKEAPKSGVEPKDISELVKKL